MDCYFDAHTHLQMMPDRPNAIKRASDVGIKGFVCNSTAPNDWLDVSNIVSQYSEVVACYGVHPCFIKELPENWKTSLVSFLEQDKIAMIGEIGLDKLSGNMDKQEDILRQQLELGWKMNRPAHIHCVRAWDRLLHVFKTQREKMPPKLLMHSHHGNSDLIPLLIEKYNAYFSYSAIFIPENRVKIRSCMKATPLNRILIESDAPDLTCEPADIVSLTEKMSVVTGYHVDVLKRALFENAKEFIYGN